MMKSSGCVRAGWLRAGAAVVIAVGAQSALGREAARASGDGAFFGYGAAYQDVLLPAVGGGSFFTVGDALPDGRIIAATGLDVFVETSVGSGVFALGASIDSGLVGGRMDPAFLKVSPDGSRVALGAGAGLPLLVFDPAVALGGATGVIDGASASVFKVEHFDAAWADSSHLGIASGVFGSPSVVTMLDVTSDPGAPVNPTVVSNIVGASGGIAFDAAGRLYTGNGFDIAPGGSETGWIKAFDPAEWSGGAVDFEAGGVLIGDVLSASAMDFDSKGNLFVGGGDFSSGDAGTLAIVRAEALMAVLGGAGPVDAGDPLSVRRLDPRGDGFGFYGSVFNGATGELYVTDGVHWHATVPAPATALVFAAAGLAGGARRMRRAA